MWGLRIFLGFLGLILVGSPPWYRSTDAFNIETRHFALYQREKQSMFGFSVSEYRDARGRGWAIIGAPTAETIQPGVYRGGAVYRCDILRDACDLIHFDDEGHRVNMEDNRPVQADNKTLQWFGATVSASHQSGGPIMACAPRYMWFGVMEDPKRNGLKVANRREPVGTCWVARHNFGNSTEYSPCRTRSRNDRLEQFYIRKNPTLRFHGYHRQGSCQAGLGAAMSKNGDRLFIGGPGSWYWQGQFYSISSSMEFPGFMVSSYFVQRQRLQGQAIIQPLNTGDKLMYTKEGPAIEDDSYMGYSVATGDFVGNGDNGMAVGVPRGAGLLGKVILFTSNMMNHHNITGGQMGAYFGYAIASGDIDGDGLDDLLVGAPMYTVPDNPQMNIETGRIYVIYQGSGPEKFAKVDSRDGEKDRGRFGLSLASLGDIDRDGYGDFVVGAPYGGPKGLGAVFIYRGSRTGVMEKYSQVIYPEDLGTTVETFGFSVAGGLDLDGNLYPDLVVGAYESATAMFFRARSVIQMDAFMNFKSESKLISLEDTNCLLNNRTRVTCVDLQACFNYTGEGVRSEHTFDIKYVLDVKKTKTPRLFFLEKEPSNVKNVSVTMKKDHQYCRTVKVFLTAGVRDKLTSLDVEAHMSLVEDQSYPSSGRRDPRMPLQPILASTTSRKDSLSIRKNCGEDNVCIPNLNLQVTPEVPKYLLGSKTKLNLTVEVHNYGEDAFETVYELILPDGINYINIEQKERGEIPVQCSAPTIANNNTLRCDIGNPLPQGQMIKFYVFLQPQALFAPKPSYEFHMLVNSTNPEDGRTVGDNVRHVSVPIWVQTELLVEGESKPKDLYYNPDNYTADEVISELEFGPLVTHNYTIRNEGPSDIEEAEAFLIWPAQTLASEELVYLLEQPETGGNVACELAPSNYLNLKLEARRKGGYYNHWEKAGVNVQESSSGRNAISVGKGLEEDQQHVSQSEDYSRSEGDSSDLTKSRSFSSSFSQSSSSGGGGSTRVRVDASNSGGIYTQTTSSGIYGSGVSSGDYNQWGGVDAGGLIHESNADNKGTITNEGLRTMVHQEGSTFSSTIPDDVIEHSHSTINHSVTSSSRGSMSVGTNNGHQDMLKQQELLVQSRKDLPQYPNRNMNAGVVSSQPNLTSTEDLRKFLSFTSRRSSNIQVYDRNGKQYVQFTARFGTYPDRREYIEFEDGPRFPLQDRSGSQSYLPESIERGVDTRFIRILGELIRYPDGRTCIELKDGRRFLIHSYATSYSEERTYSIGGGQVVDSGTIGNQYERTSHQSSERTSNTNRYYSRNYEELNSSSTIYNKENAAYQASYDMYSSDVDPNALNSRHRRESESENDALEVEDFKRRHRRHETRQQQQQQNMDHTDDVEYEESDINDEIDDDVVRSQRQIPTCELAKCITLRCLIKPLKTGEEVWLAARYRISAKTLKKVAYEEKVKISSQLMAKVTKQPIIGAPIDEIIRSHEIYTNVEPSISPTVPDIVPLWVVVLSACAGTIILLLLIYLLHKCGFFKRNRPSDAPERQPLNRNGHFQHGDDNL